FAGGPAAPPPGPGGCVRITTGAPLPEGTDTVLIKEQAEVVDGRVRALADPGPGRHVRRRGEDVEEGALLATAGQRLTPARLALGRVYDSNRELLMGLLRAEGLEPVAWPTLPDDPAVVESALRHAGEAFDLVLTCGGVSAGEKDPLPELLHRRGRVHFWKVRMRPGMPVLLADGGTLGPALFLCLPGNPVSVLATFVALARPLLDGLQGRGPRAAWRARLSAPWDKRHERREFLRGRLSCDAEAALRVEPDPADGSHRMRAAADADVLIV